MSDHHHEFTCTECEDRVFKFGIHDNVPICETCRFIRANPDMPEHVKKFLRGHDDDDITKRD